MGKLIVTLEIVSGEGKPENYEGLIEAMLEESDHWGDFNCDVLDQIYIDEATGEEFPLGT